MTTGTLQTSLAKLSPIQREAVDWQDGAMLVLAGPGSGKTQALTCRVSRLLDSSRNRRFRVLALTFTNKAAREMTERVETFIPDLYERASIGTFHSFCTQVLRQHGIHIGVQPDFAIFSLDADRDGVLRDAIRRAADAGKPVGLDDTRLLGLIDRVKSSHSAKMDTKIVEGEDSRVKLLCRLYDAELRRVNALDFNSLVTETCRLFTTYPSFAEHYQRIYPYWLIDEFQDTNRAQYALIRNMAMGGFRNIFAVADDDQTIYEWNGANVRQIHKFCKKFSAKVLQFPTNFRCPPSIVAAANRLVVHNTQRVPGKAQSVAGRADTSDVSIHLIRFEDEDQEREGIAKRISKAGRATWERTAVLARNHRLRDGVADALRRQGVTYQLVKRHPEYLSAEMRWLTACLRLLARPTDERGFKTLVETYNAFADADLDSELLASLARSSGSHYLDAWLTAAEAARGDAELLDQARQAIERPTDPSAWDGVVASFERQVSEDGRESDLAEDLGSWKAARRQSNPRQVEQSIPGFLQELQLRSMEPEPEPHSVTLSTIHGAKGRQFGHVYLIGLADEVLPTYQSLKRGSDSRQVEEERRNCFVAITRTQERLTLSRADSYYGYPKRPSRFLNEMGLLP